MLWCMARRLATPGNGARARDDRRGRPGIEPSEAGLAYRHLGGRQWKPKLFVS